MKKMNNKGFSLVELIIVIAIMAVLIGVMAPQFLKYVEQSRRATDITNAQEIATAIQVGIADSLLKDEATAVITSTNVPNLTVEPKVKGNLAGEDFTAHYDAKTGLVEVYAGKYELYPGADADAYKNGDDSSHNAGLTADGNWTYGGGNQGGGNQGGGNQGGGNEGGDEAGE